MGNSPSGSSSYNDGVNNSNNGRRSSSTHQHSNAINTYILTNNSPGSDNNSSASSSSQQQQQTPPRRSSLFAVLGINPSSSSASASGATASNNGANGSGGTPGQAGQRNSISLNIFDFFGYGTRRGSTSASASPSTSAQTRNSAKRKIPISDKGHSSWTTATEPEDATKKEENVLESCAICTSHMGTHGAIPCHHIACAHCWKRWIEDNGNQNCMICAMPIEMVVKAPFQASSASGTAGGDARNQASDAKSSPFAKHCDKIDSLVEKLLIELLRVKDDVKDISAKLTQSREHLVRLVGNHDEFGGGNSASAFFDHSRREGAIAVIAVEQVAILEQYQRFLAISYRTMTSALNEIIQAAIEVDKHFESVSEKSNGAKPDGLDLLKQSVTEISSSGTARKQWKILHGMLVTECLAQLPELLRVCENQGHRTTFMSTYSPGLSKEYGKISDLFNKFCETTDLLIVKIQSWE